MSATSAAAPSRARGRGDRLSAFIAFALLAFVATFFVWRDPTHASAGPIGDNWNFMNLLAWTPHALSQGHNPLFLGVLDYPHGINLTWNTSVPLGGVVMWPATAVFGPVVSFNLFVIISITLNGWCTFLWVRRHTNHALSAFFAAVVIALGPWLSPDHITQLQMLSIWPIPLMFIALENVIDGRHRTLTWGAVLGVTAAVLFYLSTELLVIAGLGMAAWIIFALLAWQERIRAPLLRTAAGLALGGAVLVVLASPFVAYQLLGPYVLHGVIRGPNFYVADLENLIVPTASTWLFPHSLTQSSVAAWTGSAEAIAYLGLPLLLCGGYAFVRWRREALVSTIAAAALVMMLLSLGPHLHIAGRDTGIRLPEALIDHIPLVNQLVPVRFALMAQFGLTLLLGLTLDRTLFAAPLKARLGSVAGVAAVASMISVVPFATTTATIPAYFSPSGAASSLPRTTVALVGPYIDAPPETYTPMLWQAEADFRFSLIDGIATTADSRGNVVFIFDTPLYRAFHSIQTDGAMPDQTPPTRQALIANLHTNGVNLVLIGPMAHRDVATRFVTWLLGYAPSQVQGVSVWRTIPAS